jgi:hypothetical protein
MSGGFTPCTSSPTSRLRSFLEDQDQAVGHQHLLQVLALVQEAEEGPLQHVAQDHGQHQADEQRGEEAAAEGAATTGASA